MIGQRRRICLVQDERLQVDRLSLISVLGRGQGHCSGVTVDSVKTVVSVGPSTYNRG